MKEITRAGNKKDSPPALPGDDRNERGESTKKGR
jgi:hypothetical protein